jgi:hypothetical protein
MSRKSKFLIFVLTLLCNGLVAQQNFGVSENSTFKRHAFKWGLGFGMEDGLSLTSKMPCLSIAYEYNLSKYFSLNAHIFSYYRAYNDFIKKDAAFPFIDKFMESNSPFLTDLERQNINDRGLKALDGDYTYKLLSVPIDFSFTAYPLSIKHHRAGVNVGLCLTYDNYTWARDNFVGVLTVPSKNFKGDVRMTTNTFYRGFSTGATLKLLYEYSFKDYLIGTRIANYSVLMTNVFYDKNLPVWETSLYFGLKF